MVDEQPSLLENALARTEEDADAALKVAAKVVGALKALQKAARDGELRKLRAAPDTLRQSMATLDREVARVAGSWDFDEEGYLRDGGFVTELLREARRQGLNLSQQDDRLYSYPVLISVAPAERAVKIDRKPERRIRPSVLIGLLRERQQHQPRFKSAAFLESLRLASKIAIARQPKDRHASSVVPLREIYELFTLMPGQSREYTLPEFTRDVYLLDQSGENSTRDGARVEFHASTGTKSDRLALSIVTQNGAEKKYYGISFSGGKH